MSARLPLKLGSSDARGDDVTHWQNWARNYAKSYASLMGPVDGYYGMSDAAFTTEMQTRLAKSGKPVPITGIFDETTARFTGYKAAAPTVEHRPIWMYSAPGSGADWWMGPPFDAAEWCKTAFNLNHQPVGFPKGGYLGLLGGDPGLSYDEVIAGEATELERLIATCPDLSSPAWESWYFAYSQSADGMKCAIRDLYGDANETSHGRVGRFRDRRDRINGLILFGDPTRPPGPTKVGNNPKGWGISRKRFPKWLDDLTWSITTHYDMYACTTDDTLLPLFYEWFVKAETELSFVGYCAGIIIPAIASYMGIAAPVLNALGLAPLAAIAAAGGLGLGFLGQLVGSYGGGASPNPELIAALSARGLLTPQGIVRVFNTLAALPGIQTHAEYYLPKQEFGGRTGIQVACDIVKNFRR